VHAQMPPQAPAEAEPTTDALFDTLFHEMAALREHVTREGEAYLARFGPEAAAGPAAASARNLAHYIALRQHDLRPLQERLARVGLSSLGRCEGSVLFTIDRVGELLGRVLGRAWPGAQAEAGTPPAPGFGEGREVVERAANSLFGPPAPDRAVRIMVTLPSDAATDPARVRSLVDAGMTCARINCAHDDADAWRAMADHVRRAEAETGRTCRIQMDLAGHKIRTAALTLRGDRLRLEAARPAPGADRVPARVVLWGGGEGPVPAAAEGMPVLVLPAAVIGDLKPRDRFRFADLRGKTRDLVVGKALGEGAWLARCPRTAVLGPDLPLRRARPNGAGRHHSLGEARVVDTRAPVDEARVREGERFRLGGAPEAGEGGPYLTVECTHPGVLAALKPGDPVWIDDGRLGAVTETLDATGAWLRVARAGERGAVIRRDKGLNLPATALDLPPLTPKDLADLDAVCALADVVGFSFVESGDDMERLGAALAERGRPKMPVVAKIETADGVHNLPRILLASMGRHPVGVMIARGDLAVELGDVRMAEIQEEMLWLCEAAHVPLVWATQVLERLAKKGMSSRPELTDAAMGVRAECVMLNKGPYVTRAVNTLDRILSRMQDHQRKKTSRLRALNCWKV